MAGSMQDFPSTWMMQDSEKLVKKKKNSLSLFSAAQTSNDISEKLHFPGVGTYLHMQKFGPQLNCLGPLSFNSLGTPAFSFLHVSWSTDYIYFFKKKVA